MGQFFSLFLEKIVSFPGTYFLASILLVIASCNFLFSKSIIFSFNALVASWMLVGSLMLIYMLLATKSGSENMLLKFTYYGISPFLIGVMIGKSIDERISQSIWLLGFFTASFLLFLYVENPNIFVSDRFLPFSVLEIDELGSFNDPSSAFLNFYFVGIVIFCLASLMYKAQSLLNWLYVPIIIFSLIMLFFLGTRAGIISAWLIIIMFIFRSKFWGVCLLILFLATSVYLLLGLGDNPRFDFFSEVFLRHDYSQLLNSCDREGIGSIEIRLYFLHSALDLINLYPALGVGPGNSLNHQKCALFFDGHPHNVIVQVFSEFGMILGVLFVLTLAFTFKKGFKFSKSGISNEAIVNNFVYLMFVFSLFMALFSGSLSDSLHLFLLGGVISSRKCVNTDTRY